MTGIIRDEKELEIELRVLDGPIVPEQPGLRLAATIRALWAERDSTQRSRVIGEIAEKATSQWAIKTLQGEVAQLAATIARKDEALEVALEPLKRLLVRLNQQMPPLPENDAVTWLVYEKPITVGDVRRIVASFEKALSPDDGGK